MHNKGIASHQKAKSTDKRVVILTRSGFIGQQRYGSNTWSGDVQSTWESLRNHIPAAQNYALMGIPNWNSDIGGYFAYNWRDDKGNMKDGYPELYARWMQFGTFSPMMRSHGLAVPARYGISANGAMLHSTLRKNDKTALSPAPLYLQHIVERFGQRRPVHTAANDRLHLRQECLRQGRRIHVRQEHAGVPRYTGRCRHLGCISARRRRMVGLLTNEKHDGGRTVKKATPVDIIPLYVRAAA